MKLRLLTGTILLSFWMSLPADACTGLIAGRKATTDGSVLVTYSADSHTLYGALERTPAADWAKGSKLQIIEWDTNKPLGEIDQVEHTYAVLGNMNEHQVTIVESTWGGRTELADTTGIIDYGSLMQLGLQRARTAREAIDVMTSLVDRYGYYSSGESFTIADPNEVWIMEMIGKGPGRRGAVWVAVRIPDDSIRPMSSLLPARWATSKAKIKISVLRMPMHLPISGHYVVVKPAYGGSSAVTTKLWTAIFRISMARAKYRSRCIYVRHGNYRCKT